VTISNTIRNRKCNGDAALARSQGDDVRHGVRSRQLRTQARPFWRQVLIGGTAGLLATLPMTAFMWAARAKLRWYERYSMPPRQITMCLARATGLAHHLDERRRTIATATAHFGYGSATGCLYGLIFRNPAVRQVSTGVAYGMAVWAGSYLGVLPALGILKPATQHPARRTVLMIGAHVVWGATLGYLTNRIHTIADED